MKTPTQKRGDEARKKVRLAVRELVRVIGDGAAAEFLREEAGRVELLGDANARLAGISDHPHVKEMEKRRRLLRPPREDS